jgi:uncharacterized membrane protein YgcG
LQKTTRRITVLALSMFIVMAVSTLSTLSSVKAETGKGTDVFKVILSVFGIQPTTGDIVTIVNVNGESKVKLFDTTNIAVNSTQGGGIQEFVATFPNVNVNVGDEYKACALLLKDLSPDNLICKTGLNSPAKRAEYVDLSLAGNGGEAAAETDAGGGGGGEDAGGGGGGEDAGGGGGGG